MLGWRARGQRHRLGRVLGKAFRSLVSIAREPVAPKAQSPYLPAVFPRKGGQVGACGSFIISLVSFFVIASKKFQARNLCFAFRLWFSPNGELALLLAKLAPTHFGARFARPIKTSVSLRSTDFQFFFHKSKKKNWVPNKITFKIAILNIILSLYSSSIVPVQNHFKTQINH